MALGITFIALMVNPNFPFGPSPLPRQEETPKISKQEVIDLVAIAKWSWRKKGFDNVMEADFTIENRSPYDVKDLKIKCVHTAPSGTVIDRNTRTIYEVIKAGETREFKNFSMGFIHSQVESSSASLVDLVVIE